MVALTQETQLVWFSQVSGGAVGVSVVVGTSLVVKVGSTVTLGEVLLFCCAADTQSAARQVAAQSSPRETPAIVSSRQASGEKAAAERSSRPTLRPLRRRPRRSRPAGARGGHVRGGAGGGVSRMEAGRERPPGSPRDGGGRRHLSPSVRRAGLLLSPTGPRATPWVRPQVCSREASRPGPGEDGTAHVTQGGASAQAACKASRDLLGSAVPGSV